MQSQTDTEAQPELDSTKLLGFRNLIPVTNREIDIRESADLAFNKRGESIPT